MSEKVISMIAGKILAAVVSQKGGCGKSFKTRCLVQAGRYRGHEVGVYDGDSLIGTTYRALGSRDTNGRLLTEQDPLVGAGQYSLRLDSQREELLNSLATGANTLVHDLPGGEWRRVQRARGYRYVLVNGEVTIRDDEQTATYSGQLLRHGKGRPAATRRAA